GGKSKPKRGGSHGNPWGAPRGIGTGPKPPRLKKGVVQIPRLKQPTASTTGSAGTWSSIRSATARPNFVPINRSRQTGRSQFLRSRAYRHRILPTTLG